MTKREWRKPELDQLGVSKTENGQKITAHVDDTITYNGYTFYSFS